MQCGTLHFHSVMLSIHGAYVCVWMLENDLWLLGVAGPCTQLFWYTEYIIIYTVDAEELKWVRSLDASRGIYRYSLHWRSSLKQRIPTVNQIADPAECQAPINSGGMFLLSEQWEDLCPSFFLLNIWPDAAFEHLPALNLGLERCSHQCFFIIFCHARRLTNGRVHVVTPLFEKHWLQHTVTLYWAHFASR